MPSVTQTFTVDEALMRDAFFSPPLDLSTATSFTASLSSSVWETQPGVGVVVVLKQSRDGGVTWADLLDFRSVTGPAPGPDGLTHRPSMTVTLPAVTGPQSVQLVISPEMPLLLGATVTAA